MRMLNFSSIKKA